MNSGAPIDLQSFADGNGDGVGDVVVIADVVAVIAARRWKEGLQPEVTKQLAALSTASCLNLSADDLVEYEETWEPDSPTARFMGIRLPVEGFVTSYFYLGISRSEDDTPEFLEARRAAAETEWAFPASTRSGHV